MMVFLEGLVTTKILSNQQQQKWKMITRCCSSFVHCDRVTHSAAAAPPSCCRGRPFCARADRSRCYYCEI